MKLFEYEEKTFPYQPDPYILKGTDGKFYIYSSCRTGVQGFVADELCGKYSSLGCVFAAEGKKEYWAPAVNFYKGRYYMYVSMMDKDADDVHTETMAVAVSDHPAGPFVYLNDIIAPFSIDAHVVERGGELYIFYSSNDYEADRAGTYILLDKMISPTECEGKPVAVVKPTLDEEIFMKDRFRKGQHWHTLEGAYYFCEGDEHYLIYSGNCYESEYYYLGYAYAKGECADLRDLTFKKMPDEDTYKPLIARNEYEAGTGHCSVIKENGQYYCVYHGRDIPPDERLGEDTRTARICKLHLNGSLLTAERYESKV